MRIHLGLVNACLWSIAGHAIECFLGVWDFNLASGSMLGFNVQRVLLGQLRWASAIGNALANVLRIVAARILRAFFRLLNDNGSQYCTTHRGCRRHDWRSRETIIGRRGLGKAT